MLTPEERKRLEKQIHDVDVDRLTVVFDALSDSNRCLIFRTLTHSQNASVGDIANVVGISAPLASRHLKVLLQSGLLTKTKSGKTVYYEINTADPLVSALQKAVEG